MTGTGHSWQHHVWRLNVDYNKRPPWWYWQPWRVEMFKYWFLPIMKWRIINWNWNGIIISKFHKKLNNKYFARSRRCCRLGCWDACDNPSTEWSQCWRSRERLNTRWRPLDNLARFAEYRFVMVFPRFWVISYYLYTNSEAHFILIFNFKLLLRIWSMSCQFYLFCELDCSSDFCDFSLYVD